MKLIKFWVIYVDIEPKCKAVLFSQNNGKTVQTFKRDSIMKQNETTALPILNLTKNYFSYTLLYYNTVYKGKKKKVKFSWGVPMN